MQKLIGLNDLHHLIWLKLGAVSTLDARTSNVNNTSDANKPVSTAQATAIATKAFINHQIKGTLTIPITGWVASTGTGTYVFKLTLALAGIVALDSISISVNPASDQHAQNCGT